MEELFEDTQASLTTKDLVSLAATVRGLFERETGRNDYMMAV